MIPTTEEAGKERMTGLDGPHSRPALEHGMAVIKNRFLGLGGWRRPALLGGLGVLAALALPPVYALPFLIPAFSGLLWSVEECSTPAKAFAAGWWFGFGHSAAGLSWIGFAFLVDAPRFAWMSPFAVLGMAAGMALFPAGAAALSRYVFGKIRLSGVGRVIIFSAFWVSLEWFRGWVLTGFPWNLLGTVWTWSDAMIQLAALTGVYGLSLLTVFVAAMPALLAGPGPDAEKNRPGPRPLVLASLALLGVVWAGGQWRLAMATEDVVPGVRLRLVQPNIPQALKWRPELRQGHVLKQLAMSRKPPPPGGPPTHIIWAETAVPFVLQENPGLIKALGAAAPPDGLIIVGSPRSTPGGEKPRRIWNSIYAIDSKGQIKGTYDKHHLVPFGEYVPFRGILPIEKLTQGRLDFSPGPGIRTFNWQGLPPVSPLICYEVIFPGRVTDAGNRAEWLLNLTNDAWFGNSSGPYQHFAASRLRAVEEGLPLVRVANTGISGVIDGYGRVIRRLGLGREGIIDSPLPAKISGNTPFSLLGDWITGVILIMTMVAGGLLTKPPSKRETS